MGGTSHEPPAGRILMDRVWWGKHVVGSWKNRPAALCGCGCFSGVFRPCMLRQWLLVVGVGVWVLLCKWIVDASIWGNTIVFLLL